jgi:inosose dehydratase
MSIHVGTAPDSWGVRGPLDPLQTPWQRFLDEVAESGYAAIELGPFGYLPTDPKLVEDELERRSLQLAGGTISGDLSAPDGWPAMRETTASICDVLEHLGAHFLVLLDAGHAGASELDEPGWGHLRDTVCDFWN